MKETEFDISVRNLLEGAEEPVSGKVWKGVSAAIAPARTFVLPFRTYALAFAAAAAAIVLGVFVFRPEASTRVSNPGSIALIPTQINTPLAEATVATPVRRQVAPSAAENTTLEYVEEVSSLPVSDELEANTIVKEVPAPVRGSVPAMQSFIDDNAALNRLAFAEQNPPKPFAALTASGDFQNNSRNAFARTFRAYRAIQSPDQEGIYNASPEVAFGLPVAFGLSATLNFAQKWSLGIGLRYTWLTRTFVGDYYDSALFPVAEQTDIDNYQHWLGMPVNLYFHLLNNKFWSFHTFVGATAEFLMDNEYLIHAEPQDVHYHQSKGYPPQLSFGAGVGVEFRFADNVGIYLDPSLRYYIGTQKQPRSIRTVQPLRVDVEAGFRFYFGD